MQHARFTHEGFGNSMGLRDGGQFLIEHAGESEQVVALVLQRDAHGADVSRVLGLAARQLLDDEVEQLLPGGQRRPGQRQNVMAQPLGERSDVAGQPMRLGLGLPGKRQRDGELVVGTPQAGAAGLGLQRLAPRGGALGEARQRVGETLAPALDVKHVAVARRVAPGRLLPGAQALSCIGDRVVGPHLIENGVKAVANVVIIGGQGKPPFGVLQIDSRTPRPFTDIDTAFLCSYANLLAAAVDRLRLIGNMRDGEARLRLALDAAEMGSWDLDLLDGSARRSPWHDRIFGYPDPMPE